MHVQDCEVACFQRTMCSFLVPDPLFLSVVRVCRQLEGLMTQIMVGRNVL